MTNPEYSDPRALRQAITDRLRRLASQREGSHLADLQRQFAYDRLLSRVFQDRERWVLKGATAMLARLEGRARHTVDVDLYNRSGGLDEAEGALRAAALVDLGDYFRFELGPDEAVAQGGRARRIPVGAYLGVTEFARFHVDVANLRMTGVPDEVSPLVPIELPGVDGTTYRAYPVVDHIADKVCGLAEFHARADEPTVESTRYRDLADLVAFARTASVRAAGLVSAIESEAQRRQIELPTRLRTPPELIGPRAMRGSRAMPLRFARRISEQRWRRWVVSSIPCCRAKRPGRGTHSHSAGSRRRASERLIVFTSVYIL